MLRTALLPVFFLLACSQARTDGADESPVKEQAADLPATLASVDQDADALEVQVADSVATAAISPEGGQVELPGFAWVSFPEGAFDSIREVTIAATNDPDERGLFKLSVGIGSAEHEIRILTGTSAPATSIEVAVKVPAEFLEQVPQNRVPILFARGRYVSQLEILDEYIQIQSEFDEKDHTVSAHVRPGFFEEYQRGRGLQAVLVIAAAISR